MRLLAYVVPEYKREPVEYVFQFFSTCIGKKISLIDPNTSCSGDIVLVYAKNIPSRFINCRLIIHIQPSDFFTNEFYLKKKSMPTGLAYSGELPYFLFPGQQKVSSNQFPDIVANIFFMLTSYEELVDCGTRDKRQRRHFTSSVFSQYNFLDSPIIDRWLSRLKTLITRETGFRFENLKWQGNPFAFVITRDIDSLSTLYPFRWRGFIKALAAGKPFDYLLSVKSSVNKKRDRHNNLEEIIEWEKKNNIRSSFYFIASEESGDANYAIEEVASREIVKTMMRQGWEIGFHPGANAFQDHQQFANEKIRLENAFGVRVYGGRQHGLRFSNPHTWRLWEENNIQYDSTVGFAEHEGFKAGTCKPYFIFDLLENRQLDLLEIPITLMDCTLDKYRHLNPKQMEDVCHKLLNAVKQEHGVFMLLWHNSYFGRNNIEGYHDILERLVRTALQNQALVTTANDVNILWRDWVKQNDLI